MKCKTISLGALAAVTFLGCVHVPKEAPELSLALSERMQAVKAAHVQSVRLYMLAKRAEIDAFIAPTARRGHSTG